MITNKDIRVENGNLVLNGDKFPLDGQSPEAIMAIVEGNSDTTPTADSSVPVTSAGVKNYVDTVVAGQIKDLHFAVFEHEFTDIDITNAWGSLYESTDTLSFDISSLHLQSAPKFAIVSLKSTGAACITTAPTSTTTAINFRAVRPNTATDLTIVATALVIY